MVDYVLGFAFNPTKEEIVLIEKQKPEHLIGLWSGLGGKREHGESFSTAMSREFFEEAGVLIPESEWTPFAIIEECTPDGWDTLQIFKTFEPQMWLAKSMEAEQVKIFSMEEIHELKISRLSRWLIWLALDPAHFGLCRMRRTLSD